jgi:PhnB protein
MAVDPIPKGYHTVTPYLFTSGADILLDFVRRAFDATERIRIPRPDGSVMHAEVQIGDSRVMIGDATGPAAAFGPMPTSIYLYVTDCDAVYRQALQAGGTSVAEVRNIPFNGERYGGVKDPTGNIWWIATHVRDVSPEESQRLMDAANRA